jgi:hypothetical protein
MRPSQNKRMRGRNNSNRKGPNPLSRTYESNGPDVKIRGTAHHIGEKYLQLARDAQSSGDPVMAESYLQHAEHYFRLIAAAQQAQQAAFGYQRQPGEAEVEEVDEDEDFTGIPDRFASPIERVQPPAQQPYAAQPTQLAMPERPERERPVYSNGDRPNYERQERSGNRQDRNPDRGDRGNNDRNNAERPYQDKRNAPRDGEGRGPRARGGRDFRPEFRPDYRQDNRSERVERNENRAPADEIASPSLPAFITAPVRLQQDVHGGDAHEGIANDYIERTDPEGEASGFHLRPRRRRRTKAELGIGEGAGETAPASDPVGD